MFNDRPVKIPPITPISRSLTKSTPRAQTVKPLPHKPKAKHQTEDDISVQSLSQTADRGIETTEDPFLIPVVEPRKETRCSQSCLEQLPSELLELIIGHVVGHLGSTTSEPSGSQHTVRNWNAIMRHPRRKKVADLALVSHTWRRLIQERVYRHIKIQGTKAALEECGDWFLKNAHLQAFVRHFEVLVPIWEMKPGQFQPRFMVDSRSDGQATLFRAFQGLAINTPWAGDIQEATTAFQLASKNATMEEIFGCAQSLLPDLCALTIEGGHCKRPPKIQYFHDHKKPQSLSPTLQYTPPIYPMYSPGIPQQLPLLPNTKTLILKGAWNVIRSSTDFSILASALPALREFHCTYHKPKTGAYIATCNALKYGFPPTLTHLNLCLEGLYTKNASSLKKWRKLYPAYHICRNLGAIAPQLESLTYTGRVCGALFTSAVKATENHRGKCERLKSIDIVVNNVCRDPCTHNDGTGVHNWPFIQAFESLVVQAVRCLQSYTEVRNMRIRFIDLDSPAPLLNPTFHMEAGRAWGLYSDEILELLKAARPKVQFLGLVGRLIDNEGNTLEEKQGKKDKRSMSIGYYKAMAQAGGLV